MTDWYKEFQKKSDEELGTWICVNAQIGSPASNLAIAELTRRSVEKSEKAIQRLEKSIDYFSKSSDKYSKKLIGLTWALVILTITLLVPVIVESIKYFSER
jgi:cobalamin biosynthesis protein CobD/CbiB